LVTVEIRRLYAIFFKGIPLIPPINDNVTERLQISFCKDLKCLFFLLLYFSQNEGTDDDLYLNILCPTSFKEMSWPIKFIMDARPGLKRPDVLGIYISVNILRCNILFHSIQFYITFNSYKFSFNFKLQLQSYFF
jgi:hypothetical protein